MQKYWNDIVYWWEKTAPKIWTEIGEWWTDAMPVLLNAAIILFFGFWLVRIFTKLLRRVLEKGKADPGIRQFTLSLVNTLLKGLVILTTLSTLGVNVTSIIAALGAAGVTAGLALKDSLSNFVSGVTLLYTRPFKVGDYILFSGNEGTVIEIQLMYTILRMPDNKHVVIPNSHLTATQLVNSSSEESRRSEFSFVVAGASDAAKAMDTLREVLDNCPMTLEAPAVQIRFTGMDERGVTVTAYAWCRSENLLDFQHMIWEKAQIAFQEKQIPLSDHRLLVNFLEKNDLSSPSVD